MGQARHAGSRKDEPRDTHEATLERVAQRADRVPVGLLAAWTEAVVRLSAADRLGDVVRGLALLDEAERSIPDDAPDGALHLARGRAALLLLAGRTDAAEAVLEALGNHRTRQEAWSLVAAARGAAHQGRLAEARAWLERGARLSYPLSDADPILASLHREALAMADHLVRTGTVDPLTRTAVTFARGTAERAGSWEDVKHSEVLLSEAHLLFGEAVAAAAHAEVAAAMCRHNHADGAVLREANELLVRARAAQ